MNQIASIAPRPKKLASARIGQNVRYIMHARDINQVRLAQELGLTESQVSRRIKGTVDWTPDDIEITARLLGVRIERLFSKLLDLDSNQEPTGYGTAALGRELVKLSDHRDAKKRAHSDVATSHTAKVTPLQFRAE